MFIQSQLHINIVVYQIASMLCCKKTYDVMNQVYGSNFVDIFVEGYLHCGWIVQK